ncbi:MAG: AI-2E family transporter [Candidatus Dormibacteria bacterium]
MPASLPGLPPPAARVPIPGADPGKSGTDDSGLRRSALQWARATAVLLTIFLGYQLFLVLRGMTAAILSVVISVLVAIIITFLGTPLVIRMERRARMPRTLAVLLTLVVGLGLLALLVWLLSGPLVTEGRGLATQAPSFVHRLDSQIATLERQLKGHGIRINAVNFVTSKLSTLVPQLTGVVVSGVTGALGALIDAVVAIVLAFWLLKDGAELRRSFVGLFPTRVARELDFGLDAFAVVIGGYVRAQLFLAIVVGAMAGVGTAVLGVPFPLVVALAAGVFELIPLVGPFVGGGVALLLALTKSPTLAIFTLILFLGIHVIEGYLLVPRIQARFLQLHPILTMLALFAGVEAAGFLGALVAVPATSYITVLIRAWVGDWRAQRPDLFTVSHGDSLGDIRNRRLLRSFRIFSRRSEPSAGGTPPGPPPPTSSG